MLKLFSNKNAFTEKNRKFIFPLLFDLHYVKNQSLLEYYELVDAIEESHIAVFPIEIGYSMKMRTNDLSAFLLQAKQFNKPVWVFSGGDFGFTLSKKNVFNFRLGGFKSKLNNKTQIMPSFINDPYSTFLKQGFSKIIKKAKPEIGFVGHADSGFLKYVKELYNFFKINFKRLSKKKYGDYQPFFPSGIKRSNYLKALSKKNAIITKFIYRNKYRAGVKNDIDLYETSKEFYENIFANAYTFCIRGGGNFSVRFYETLAVGRIPILIDTDCQLPLQDLINWKEHCLIINAEKIEDIVKYIINFHNNISEKDFELMQENNRKLWEQTLRRDNYFKHIHNKFIKIIKNI